MLGRYTDPPNMELKRRFLFHGDAVAIGGRIVRPKDVFLDANCASALSVSGGTSSCQVKGKKFEKYLRFGSAETWAEGRFDDRKRLVSVTEGHGDLKDLTATTTVFAEVRDLTVGSKDFRPVQPEMTVKRVRGSLIAKSPATPEEETSVSLGSDVSIDGVAFDGVRLIVELDRTLLQEHDTYSKLRRVAADPAFVEGNAIQFARGAIIDGKPQTGLIEVRGTCYGSLVRSMRWAGKPHPQVTIDGHMLKVENFGRIFVGEFLVSGNQRRITMLRFEFASPFGGDGDVCNYQDNGGWYP